MTDFIGEYLISDDGSQDLTVPDFMAGFIRDLSEAKKSPVTFAEYIQALINKIHAHPEVWDMATVFNT